MAQAFLFPRRVVVRAPCTAQIRRVPLQGERLQRSLRSLDALQAADEQVLLSEVSLDGPLRQLAAQVGDHARRVAEGRDGYLPLSARPLKDKLARLAESAAVVAENRVSQRTLADLLSTEALRDPATFTASAGLPTQALEDRVIQALDSGLLGLGQVITGLDRGSAQLLVASAMADDLRAAAGIHLPALQHPGAPFQTVRINDPVLAASFTLSWGWEATSALVQRYLVQADAYWSALEATGLYNADDIEFLRAARLLPPKPGKGDDTTAWDLLVHEHASMTEVLAHQADSWRACQSFHDEARRVCRGAADLVAQHSAVQVADSCGACGGTGLPRHGEAYHCATCQGTGALFTRDSWPDTFRTADLDGRDAWLVRAALDRCGLPSERAPAYLGLYRSLLPAIRSVFQHTVDQASRRSTATGWTAPLVVQSEELVPRVAQVLAAVALESCMTFRCDVFGGLAVQGSMGMSLRSPAAGDEDEGFSWDSGASLLRDEMADEYDGAATGRALDEWATAELRRLRLDRWQFPQVAAASLDALIQQRDAFRLAEASARKLRDLQAARGLFLEQAALTPLIDEPDVYHWVPPVDGVVSDVYAKPGEFIRAQQPLLLLQSEFDRRVTLNMGIDEFSASPLVPEGLFELRFADPALAHPTLACMLFVDAVRPAADGAAMLVEGTMLLCLRVAEYLKRTIPQPALLPLSNRLVELLGIDDSLLEAARRLLQVGARAVSVVPA